MYQLIGSPKTRAFRVLWMMEELGVDYEILPSSPQGSAILAANPSGKVPALMVGDEIIVDSVAIIQFLADKHDKFTFKAGTIERGRQDSFLHFANDEMDGTCWTAAKHSFAFPPEHRVAGVLEACKWDWGRTIKVFEQRLGDNEFVMGDQFTVPDFVICHVAGWAKITGFDWPEGAVSDYFKRVRSRPAFKRSTQIRKDS